MRWSKLKQLVEDRMADSLQRRVEVHSTWYRRLGHDHLGRTWITIDKHEMANMCDLRYWNQYAPLMSEIRVANNATDYRDPAQWTQYYAAYDQAEALLHQQGVYDRGDCNRLLASYLHLSVDDALRSDEVLIRALAMLDSRLGKRRLRTLHLADDEHPLVRQFYDLRCEAEGIGTQSISA